MSQDLHPAKIFSRKVRALIDQEMRSGRVKTHDVIPGLIGHLVQAWCQWKPDDVDWDLHGKLLLGHVEFAIEETKKIIEERRANG